jgi:Tol biopolymer transport system component
MLTHDGWGQGSHSPLRPVEIVFSSTRKLDGTDAANANATTNIWRVNADGGDLKPLTNLTATGAYSYAPDWSADGTKVVFYSSRKLDGTDAANANGTTNIWRVSVDGSDSRPLTRATALNADSYGPRFTR